MKKSQYWNDFATAVASILGIKDLLLLEWRKRFGGRVFIPVTGGGFTSSLVMKWLDELFMPLTSTGKSQSSRVKNAYGSSEFPGISVNGEINRSIDLELVPVPEYDEYDTSDVTSPIVKSRRGERFNPEVLTPSNKRIGEIRVRNKDRTANVQYWKNSTATNAIFRDGWYYTGDIGRILVKVNITHFYHFWW
jgi:long-subunit acyl-CoA synthetase (AMP-forming)